jgi:hypothetical protein
LYFCITARGGKPESIQGRGLNLEKIFGRKIIAQGKKAAAQTNGTRFAL